MRMMIVDDSNVIRSRISRVVQSGGLWPLSLVGLARSGAEALRIARAARPDVVTLDLTIPQLDGAACVSQMLRLLPGAGILVVSALSDRASALEAVRLGARDYVAKPFTDDELKAALLNVMTVR